MKTKFLMLFLLVVLSSCSNDDKAVYSDDSRINNWVKENRSDFSNIVLEEISNYHGEEQRAIFRLIDSKNRKEIWLNKVNILIKKYPSQSIVFNDLLKFIENYNFEKNLTKDDVVFFKELIEKGRKEFNWNDEFIGITLCSFEYYNSNHNYNIFSKVDGGGIGGEDGDLPTCNCKWGGMFACGSLDCKSNCEDDGKKGCGFLLMETCTGICD